MLNPLDQFQLFANNTSCWYLGNDERYWRLSLPWTDQSTNFEANILLGERERTIQNSYSREVLLLTSWAKHFHGRPPPRTLAITLRPKPMA